MQRKKGTCLLLHHFMAAFDRSVIILLGKGINNLYHLYFGKRSLEFVDCSKASIESNVEIRVLFMQHFSYFDDGDDMTCEIACVKLDFDFVAKFYACTHYSITKRNSFQRKIGSMVKKNFNTIKCLYSSIRYMFMAFNYC